MPSHNINHRMEDGLAWRRRPFLLEVNHSPSFICDSPLDLSVKSAVLRATMEMVSPSKDEWKLMKRFPRRLPPEVRERLVELRENYESNHADRLSFDPLSPPSAATFGGQEAAAKALHERYDGYLSVAAQLYGNMSLTGSRRQATNCGTKQPNECSNNGQHLRIGGWRTGRAPSAAVPTKQFPHDSQGFRGGAPPSAGSGNGFQRARAHQSSM